MKTVHDSFEMIGLSHVGLIEVYWRTGLAHPQGLIFLSPPCALETDLSKTEEELVEELNVLTRGMGFNSSDNLQLTTGIANEQRRSPALK